MPHSYRTGLHYKVNYGKVKNILTELYKSFETPFVEHISKWLSALESIDNPTINNALTHLLSDNNQEYFCNNFTVRNDVFEVCFNVYLIIKAITQNKIPYKSLTVQLDSFSTTGKTEYIYTEENGSSTSKKPIIVTNSATLTINPEKIVNKFFVLDGNHRVSKAKQNRDKKIKVIIIDKNSLIYSDAPFFLSTYDKFVYAFFTELTEATIAIKQHHISPNTFIENSFLYHCFNSDLSLQHPN